MPETRTLPRRAVLAGLGCGALLPLASSFPRPAVASQQSVKLTLPWLAQGATAYAYVARERGLFRDRGLDVEISRGYGSVAAVQAVANKQFDVGIAFVGPALLSVARGLPVVGVTTFNYDALFGIAIRAEFRDSGAERSRRQEARRQSNISRGAVLAGVRPQDRNRPVESHRRSNGQSSVGAFAGRQAG